MSQPAFATPDDALPPAQCRHHWLIDDAEGPSSMGRCQRCGQEREFLNYLPDWVSPEWPGNDPAPADIDLLRRALRAGM